MADETYSPREWMLPPRSGYGFCEFDLDTFNACMAREGYGTSKFGVPPYINVPDIPSDRWARQLDKGGACYTYFARGHYTGRIKIGQSRDLHGRVYNLRYSSSGEPSTLLAARPGAVFERAYHHAFADWRLGNEWFAPHPDILAEIERLKECAQ